MRIDLRLLPRMALVACVVAAPSLMASAVDAGTAPDPAIDPVACAIPALVNGNLAAAGDLEVGEPYNPVGAPEIDLTTRIVTPLRGATTTVEVGSDGYPSPAFDYGNSIIQDWESRFVATQIDLDDDPGQTGCDDQLDALQLVDVGIGDIFSTRDTWYFSSVLVDAPILDIGDQAYFELTFMWDDVFGLPVLVASEQFPDFLPGAAVGVGISNDGTGVSTLQFQSDENGNPLNFQNGTGVWLQPNGDGTTWVHNASPYPGFPRLATTSAATQTGGAIVSVVTKSGGNNFSGSVRVGPDGEWLYPGSAGGDGSEVDTDIGAGAVEDDGVVSGGSGDDDLSADPGTGGGTETDGEGGTITGGDAGDEQTGAGEVAVTETEPAATTTAPSVTPPPAVEVPNEQTQSEDEGQDDGEGGGGVNPLVPIGVVGAVVVGVGVGVGATKSKSASRNAASVATGDGGDGSQAEDGEDEAGESSSASDGRWAGDAPPMSEDEAMRLLLHEVDLDDSDDKRRGQQMWQNNLVIDALDAGAEIEFTASGTPLLSIPPEIVDRAYGGTCPYGPTYWDDGGWVAVVGYENGGPQYMWQQESAD